MTQEQFEHQIKQVAILLRLVPLYMDSSLGHTAMLVGAAEGQKIDLHIAIKKGSDMARITGGYPRDKKGKPVITEIALPISKVRFTSPAEDIAKHIETLFIPAYLDARRKIRELVKLQNMRYDRREKTVKQFSKFASLVDDESGTLYLGSGFSDKPCGKIQINAAGDRVSKIELNNLSLLMAEQILQIVT